MKKALVLCFCCFAALAYAENELSSVEQKEDVLSKISEWSGLKFVYHLFNGSIIDILQKAISENRDLTLVMQSDLQESKKVIAGLKQESEMARKQMDFFQKALGVNNELLQQLQKTLVQQDKLTTKLKKELSETKNSFDQLYKESMEHKEKLEELHNALGTIQDFSNELKDALCKCNAKEIEDNKELSNKLDLIRQEAYAGREKLQRLQEETAQFQISLGTDKDLIKKLQEEVQITKEQYETLQKEFLKHKEAMIADNR